MKQPNKLYKKNDVLNCLVLVFPVVQFSNNKQNNALTYAMFKSTYCKILYNICIYTIY